MTMKRLVMIWVSLLVLVLNLNAQPWGRGKGDRHRSLLRMITLIETHKEALGVSEVQIKDLKALQEKSAERKLQTQTQCQAIQLELDKGLAMEKRDYAKIKSLMIQLAELRSDSHIDTLKAKDALKQILTAEQLKKLSELRPRKRGHRAHGRPTGRH